jgi:putative transcriptional regulator
MADSLKGMSSLAPGILIAAPPLGDPNFDRTVVLLASHDSDGAFGWVINGQPLLSVRELLEQAGISRAPSAATSWTLRESVHRGGPVATEQVWLVYPSNEQLAEVDGQMEVAPGICATASREFLERLAVGASVPSLRAFAGYAGWAPGQLESEILGGAWLPGPSSNDLVFSTDIESIWQRAYEMQGTTPIAFTTRVVGSA